MLQPVRDTAWAAVRGGAPVAEPLPDIEFEPAEEGERFIPVDCLSINTGADGFLISSHARTALAPLMDDLGEFWPVRVLGCRYWWLNCLASVDALDRERTDADWSEVSGEWGSFSWISTTRRLVFRESRLRQAPALFRIPEYPQGVLFAQDGLRCAVVQSELTGFRFEPVWSSRDGGVLDPGGLGFGGMFEAGLDEEHAARRHAARAILNKRRRQLGN